MTQITFGNGEYGVDIGTYGGKPAVYITPNSKPGPVGERVPLADQGALQRDTLLDGETVLIFPATDRCKEVADALVGSKIYGPHPSQSKAVAIELLSALQDCAEALAFARDKLGMTGEGDGKDRKADADDSIGSLPALIAARAAITRAASALS